MSKEKAEPRWLINNNNANSELSVYSGPHETQEAFVDGLVAMIQDPSSDMGDEMNTAHVLTCPLKHGVPHPEITDLSGAFMDSAREMAYGSTLTKEDKETLGI